MTGHISIVYPSSTVDGSCQTGQLVLSIDFFLVESIDGRICNIVLSKLVD